VAPIVEELAKILALSPPPEEQARDNARYDKTVASIPPYQPLSSDLDILIARKMAAMPAPPPMAAATKFAKVALGVGEALGRATEAARPLLSGLGKFVEAAALTIEELHTRPPFMFAALDAWEAFLDGDIAAIDRFIVDRLGREPDDNLRVAVQSRLEVAFAADGAKVPRWVGNSLGFDVAVCRDIRGAARAAEREIQRMIDGLRDKVGKRASLVTDRSLRYALASTYQVDPEDPKRWGFLKDRFLAEEFPGAVLLAWEDRPADEPLLPVRGIRGPNLLSRTTRLVKGLDGEAYKLRKVATKKPHALTSADADGTGGDMGAELDLRRFAVLESERKQVRDALRDAGLSPQEVEVVHLKFWEGRSNKDIASIVSRSESQVGVEAFRGVAKITEAMRA